MEISPTMMAWLLIYCFFFGMAVGVFYDVNRILRVFIGVRYSKRKLKYLSALRLPLIKRTVKLGRTGRKGVLSGAIVFLGDVCTLVLGTLGIIILNYSYNSGELRAFTVIGTLVGFFVYYNTLGRLVMMLSEPFAICIKYVILSFFIIIGYPFFKFGKNIFKIVKKIVFLCIFTLEKRREKLYNVKEEVYLLELSKNGFLKSEEN